MCWKYGPGLQLWLLRERERHLSVISLLSLFQKKDCFETMKSCRNSRLGPLSPYISETLVHRQVGQRYEMDADFIRGYKIQYYLFSQFQIRIQNTGFDIHFWHISKSETIKGWMIVLSICRCFLQSASGLYSAICSFITESRIFTQTDLL